MKILSIVAALFCFSQTVFATQSMLEGMLYTYPQARDTALTQCITCHNTNRGELLNPYGEDLKKSKLNFTAIEALDSDKDGTSNIDEINNLSNPGRRFAPTEYFTLDKTGPRGQVTFDHRSHQFEDAYISKGDCKICHLNSEFSRYITDPTSPSYVPAERHKTCYGCHIKAVNDGNPNAPKQCSGCHEK